MTKFPWARFMQFGIGELKLSPTEFWRSTPREIAAGIGRSSLPPLLRQNLNALMEDFPDDQRPDE